ncbi:hypothetical protein RSAG8_03688, partial [Rhizoctonia solani AG-8 WAC10335]
MIKYRREIWPSKIYGYFRSNRSESRPEPPNNYPTETQLTGLYALERLRRESLDTPRVNESKTSHRSLNKPENREFEGVSRDRNLIETRHWIFDRVNLDSGDPERSH